MRSSDIRNRCDSSQLLENFPVSYVATYVVHASFNDVLFSEGPFRYKRVPVLRSSLILVFVYLLHSIIGAIFGEGESKIPLNSVYVVCTHTPYSISQKMGEMGFKKYYNQSQYSELSDFIRACLGLTRCPLDRLDEAMDLLKLEGQKLPTENQQKFATKFIKYLNRNWINGKFKRETWNFYKSK